VEEIHAITHTGSHVDAPYHATSEGKPARRIAVACGGWIHFIVRR
jgi:kynurenine formamidase